MRLATIRISGEKRACIVTADKVLPICRLNAETGSEWPEDLSGLIRSGKLEELTQWYNNGGKETVAGIPGAVAKETADYAVLYDDPKRIIGVLVNFAPSREEAAKMADRHLPGVFYKPASIAIGCGEDIVIPDEPWFQGATGESEISIVIGKDCRNVPEEDWQSVVAGYTCSFDIGEASTVMGNDLIDGDWKHVYLVKQYDTFFAMGPTLVTIDEVPDPAALEVQCWKNGELLAKNVVDNMLFSPGYVVSLLSRVHGLYAGDVITMGTPKPYPIARGDVIKCVIRDSSGSGDGTDGGTVTEFEPLVCPVR